jgi:hypothetical protein
MNIKVGSSVVVKENTQDPDSDANIGGWQGRVSEILEDGKIICINWDSLTLNNTPDHMIAHSEKEGLEWDKMYLYLTDVEPIKARDTLKDVAQAIRKLQAKHAWTHWGEEGRYIKQVLEQVDTDDELAVLKTWATELKKTLCFPFEAEVTEFQERGRMQSGDSVTVKGISTADDLYGVVVQISGKHGTNAFPLCDLKSKDASSSNYVPVHAYAVWFANC